MSLAAFTLNALLAVLLFAALAMGWRLERRLKALRASHDGFAKAVADLDAAAMKAERGLADLRAATDEAAETLADRIEQARRLALRLDNAMTQASAIETAAPAARPAPREREPAPRESAVLELFARATTERPMLDRLGLTEPRQSARPTPVVPAGRSRARLDDDLFDDGAPMRAVNGGR